MSKREILTIKSQSYSSLLSNFQICTHCTIVDLDQNRIRGGYKCPVCNKPGDCGHLYFHLGIHSLINLIQEAYNFQKIVSENEDEKVIYRTDSRAHYLSIVVFFTTLREVLMQNLLDELANIKNISEPIYDRLLSDNRNYSQKQNNIFPAFLEIKWDDAVKIANGKDEIDYVALNELLVDVVNARNIFLHEGSQYSITKELAEKCILSIWSLLNLYVRFHNDYVHPYYLEKCT